MWYLVAGLIAWAVILFVAIAMARAADKPWPKRIEPFRKDQNG